MYSLITKNGGKLSRFTTTVSVSQSRGQVTPTLDLRRKLTSYGDYNNNEGGSKDSIPPCSKAQGFLEGIR